MVEHLICPRCGHTQAVCTVNAFEISPSGLTTRGLRKLVCNNGHPYTQYVEIRFREESPPDTGSDEPEVVEV